MVDDVLKSRVLALPPHEKAELRALLDLDLAGYVPADLGAELDARWSEALAEPESALTIDEDELELRGRRTVA